VLLEREILDGQKLHEYLDRVKIPPLLAIWLQSGEISSEPRTDVYRGAQWKISAGRRKRFWRAHLY
jgi:hypothetical protein